MSNIHSVKIFLVGIQHCVTVIGKLIFDSNFPFEPPLTRHDLNYFCTNYNETKGLNGYHGVFKVISFSQQIKIQAFSEVNK